MYEYQAIKVKVAGHKAIGLDEDEVWYASKLEGRTAILLIKAGIKFTPHVKFKVISPNGTWFHYTVDFLFDAPQKPLGCHKWISFLEVKGVLTRHDLLRLSALEYTMGLKGFIALPSMVDLWERDGLI